jgi:hypothetical protein
MNYLFLLMKDGMKNENEQKSDKHRDFMKEKLPDKI